MLRIRLLLVIGCAGYITGLAAQSLMTVRVWNYAGASDDVLTAAEARVNEAFADPGIQFRWIHSEVDRRIHDVTGSPVNDDVVLRIKRKSPALGSFGTDVLGRSFNDYLVDVYDAEICHIAARLAESRCDVYALAIVHEFGHILLGPHAHDSGGPMRSRWGSEEIRAVARGGLRFTKQQKERIRAAAGIRIAEREGGPHRNGGSAE